MGRKQQFNPEHNEDGLAPFFFESPKINQTLETFNEAEAWAAFHACCFPCALYKDGNILADKEFEEDEITGTMSLVEQNYTGSEYWDLEEVEA